MYTQIPGGDEVISFPFGATSELMVVHHSHIARALQVGARFGLAGLHASHWEDDSRWIAL